MENLNIQSISSYTTDNGTPVVSTANDASKDLFLKLLVAQMTNQDPFNTQDPTQYVTQLAQFTMLEELGSLNDSMDYLANINNGVLINSALSTASTLIGKHVEMSSLDDNKNQVNYNGTVIGTSIKDGTIYLELKLDGSEETKLVEYENLVKVENNIEK